MDVKKFDNNELINYLLSGEFGDELSIDDMKYLLNRFKYYCRISFSKNKALDNEIVELRKQLLNEKSLKDFIINCESEKYNILETKYNNLINKKLTLSERIFGKLKKE